jgi:site-specific recombinase XerD
LAGTAALHLVSGLALLHPEEQVFEGMLTGWASQQTSRFLNPVTVRARDRLVRRFGAYTNDYPWRWSPADVEEWTTLAITERKLAHSTIRNYHFSLRLFMEFICDSRYGWSAECLERFGTHPVQICHDWNTTAHVCDYEGRPERRPLTRGELQDLFDRADERVVEIRKRGRKGWLAAFRDATLLKVTYAWGLRRNEAVMLDIADLSANPKAPELRAVGVMAVRFAKANRGGPPRRRHVLTTMPWSVEVVEEYLVDVRELYPVGAGGMLWPTERGSRMCPQSLDQVFARLRAEAGLPAELTAHCLRHSYVTHLIEDGWDPTFVQHQVGHAWASTTSIYTGVSSDYKNRMLRTALDRVLAGDDAGGGQ